MRALKVSYYRPLAGSPAHRPFLLDPFFLSDFTCTHGPPVINSCSGSAANRYFPSWFIFLIFLSGGMDAPRVQRYRLLNWFYSPQVGSCWPFSYLFSIYLTLGFNDTDPRPDVSACPDYAVHRPSTFDPAFDLVFVYVSMCLLFPYYHLSRLPHYVEAAESW